MNKTLKKRVEQLEEKAGVNPIDIVLWMGEGGGLFGHCHITWNGTQTKTPCSDEEEIEIMRNYYETSKERSWGVPFPDYLEAFSYLAPDGLAERQRAAIDKLKGP